MPGRMQVHINLLLFNEAKADSDSKIKFQMYARMGIKHIA